MEEDEDSEREWVWRSIIEYDFFFPFQVKYLGVGQGDL